MKRFVPDNGGMFVPRSPQIQGTTQVQAFNKPASSITKLDQVLQGGPPSILVIRSQGGIGDVLMTLPTVRGLKEKYKATIDYATDFDYLGGALPKVLVGNPDIQTIWDFALVDKGGYNAVINLTCPCIAYEKPLVAPINRIDLFARHAGLTTPIANPKMNIYLTEEEKAWALKWLEERGIAGKPFILVGPNSSTKRRDMPAVTLQHSVARILAETKGYRAVIVTHSGNMSLDVNWQFAGAVEMRDYDVRRIAAITELAKLVICQDSALLHIASALERPTLTLFGPTDPRARINYFPQAVAIWFRYELHCCPCWFAPDCRTGLTCWKKIKEEHIVEIAKIMLAGSTLPAYPWLIAFPNKNLPSSPYEFL